MTSESPSPSSEEPSIAEQVAETSQRLSEHYNSTYTDAVDVLGRAHLSSSAREVAMVSIRPGHLLLRALDAEGSALEGSVPFRRSARSMLDLEALMLAAIAEARKKLGIEALTAPEKQAQQLRTVRTFVTEVVKVERLTPSFQQITFGGGDLSDFAPGGHDQFLYVMTPPVGRSALTVDASFTREDFGRFTDADRPVGGYYTLRRWRPAQAELDMIFVLHGVDQADHAAPGLSAQWANSAEPGDPAALLGPRTIYDPPADTDWLLLVADETGLPAICVILENLPVGTPAQVFVEISDERDELPLPQRDNVRVRWLYRAGAAAGATDLLVDAVRASEALPGNVYAWGGAEASSMRAVTRHLRRELGVERSRVRMTGYWYHASTPPDLNSGGE